MILLTNDDGITSAGLTALHDALRAEGHDAVVVAPDRERSAVSRALTLNRPLRVEEAGEGRYSVDGTPTDCVNLALNGLFKGRVRLVVSGINRGGNLGEDITYSGTVSAAMEGFLLGVPSIAVSLAARDGFLFDTAVQAVMPLVRHVLGHGLPFDTILNVNVPNIPFADVKGMVLTRMGKKHWGDNIVEKEDPRGRKYYWIGGTDMGFERLGGSDLEAVEDGYVSVTPLHLDLTNYAAMDTLAGAFDFLSGGTPRR